MFSMRGDTPINPTDSRTLATAAAPSNGAANGEADVPPWAAFPPSRGRLVRFVIVFSIALTLLAAASIYWRWANVAEPTSYITVQGNESLQGTVVRITSPDPRYQEPIVTLSKDNDYTATIFLDPGSYTVTATLNGDQLARADFVISGRKAAMVNLVNRRPGAAHTAAPADPS
jgi:hypothetical protein